MVIINKEWLFHHWIPGAKEGLPTPKPPHFSSQNTFVRERSINLLCE